MSQNILNSKIIAGGPDSTTLVFLPGFAGSLDMWDSNFQALKEHYQLVLLDTLGFGNSPKPDIAYTVDDHLRAIEVTLKCLDVTHFHLVGYSMGSLLALAYACQNRPGLDKLVLLAWPCYRNEQQARAILKQTNLFTRLLALDNPLAHLICGLMCRTRPLVKLVIPFLVRHVPAVVAKGSLDHTWTSYSRTLQHVIFQSQSREWIDQIARPALFIHGRKDKTAPLANVEELLKPDSQRKLVIIDEADHNLIFTHSQRIATEISAFLHNKVK